MSANVAPAVVVAEAMFDAALAGDSETLAALKTLVETPGAVAAWAKRRAVAKYAGECLDRGDDPREWHAGALSVDELADWVGEGRDLSKLVKKVITDVRGRKTTVYVLAGAKAAAGMAGKVAAAVGEKGEKLDAKVAASAVGVPYKVAKRGLKWVKDRYTGLMTRTQEVAKQAARERGLPEAHIEKLGKMIAAGDLALSWATSKGTMLATGSIPAGYAAGALPTASLGYLTYSTARNPKATYRAAKLYREGKLKGKPPAPRVEPPPPPTAESRDFSKLDKKRITRKDGVETTVYVLAGTGGASPSEALDRAKPENPKEGRAAAAVSRKLGRTIDAKTLKALGNAVKTPDNAKVVVEIGFGKTVLLKLRSLHGVTAKRELRVDKDGGLRLTNDLFVLPKKPTDAERTLAESPQPSVVSAKRNDWDRAKKVVDDREAFERLNPGVTGFHVFTKQLAAARAAGVDRIETYGAGSLGDWTFNGYSTWPKFGFDGRLDSDHLADLPEDFAAKLPENPTVQDVFDQPGGDAVWEKHGSAINLQFDPRDGSRSMKRFEKYRAARRAKGKQ